MKKQSKLQEMLMLTDKGYSDLKKAIVACTLTNFSMMLPFSVMMAMVFELINPLLGKEISWTKMWILFGLGIIAAVIVFLFSKNDYKKTYVASYIESEKTRTSMAEHIRKLPMSVFNSKDITEITTNMMADVATTEQVLSHVIPQLFANGISITVICAVLAIYDWRMALSVFITVPVAFLIIVVSRVIYQKLSEKHVESKLAASGQVQEYIEGVKVIRACNMDGERFSALENSLRKMKQLAIQMELGTGVFVTGAQVILQAGIGITIFVGTNLLTSGRIELLTMLMFVMIVVRIYGPVITELTLLPQLFYHQIAIKRIKTLMDMEPMTGREDIVIKDYTIEFNKVNFRYNQDGEETIKNMTASIPANGITALVGPSGSGKSTVSRLIARFWDVDSGSITIGGTDVKEVDPELLMSYMSFVFQDVILFNDTVYNNIKIGNMDATEEQIHAAAKAACCDEFINKMPEGYQTMLGENGATLSGGERQRISIARALLKDAPIVLLDEATASIDPENEASIQQAISKLIEGKTVVVIAHRLRTIANADQIIVLDKGEVVETGTHNQLVRKDGLYKHLYTIQQETMDWKV